MNKSNLVSISKPFYPYVFPLFTILIFARLAREVIENETYKNFVKKNILLVTLKLLIFSLADYSTVTLFAKFLGLSTSKSFSLLQ